MSIWRRNECRNWLRTNKQRISATAHTDWSRIRKSRNPTEKWKPVATKKEHRSNKIHLLAVLIRRARSRVDSHSGSCLASDPIRSFLRPDFCSILQ